MCMPCRGLVKHSVATMSSAVGQNYSDDSLWQTQSLMKKQQMLMCLMHFVPEPQSLLTSRMALLLPWCRIMSFAPTSLLHHR